MKRSAIVRLCGIILITPALWAQAASAAEKVQFNIPAGDLAPALKVFGEQSNTDVLFDPKLAADKKTPGLKGKHETEEGLKILLEQAKLTFRVANERTVLVERREEGAGNASPAQQMRVAALGEGNSGEKSSDSAGSAEAGRDQVTVEGRREKPRPFSTANVDLTRTEDDALPFVVFTARDIEVSGAANLEQFLRYRLPQNVTDSIPEETNGLTDVGGTHNFASGIQLRGWSSSETVFLINGRRLPSRYIGDQDDGNPVAGDFRGIPLGWIERMEILPSAAGALYGANATGGVINIILRRDLAGGQVTVNAENPYKGHAPDSAVDFSYAAPLGREFSVRLAGGYAQKSTLRVEDRANVTIERWRRLIMQNAPERITDSPSSLPLGAATNIRGVFGPLFGPDTSWFTSVPDGYAGGTDIAPFLARAGLYHLDLPQGADRIGISGRAPIGADGRDWSLSFAIDKRINGDWDMSIEYLYAGSRQWGESDYAGLRGVFVDAASPVNPFGNYVWVSFDDPRLNRPELEKWRTSERHDMGVSVRGMVKEWRLLFDLRHVRSGNEGRSDRFSPLVTTGNLQNGWSQVITEGLYNPFVDMRSVSPAPQSFYDHFAIRRNDYASASNNSQFNVKASGSLPQLPGGSPQLTLGLEWSREDRTKAGSSDIFVDNVSGQVLQVLRPADAPYALFTINNYSLYGELSVPVFGSGWNYPLLRGLEAYASGRIGRQVRDGHATDGSDLSYRTTPHLYAIGLRHEIVDGATLRASRSIGFKPPSFSDITPQEPLMFPFDVIDRRRNDEIVTLNEYISGGNPDLKPETTNSTNFGVILQPRWARGLRFSVDYLESARRDALSFLSQQTVLDFESSDPLLAARVQRDPPESGAPNGVGRVVAVDARMINLAQIISQSVDFSLEKEFGAVLGGRLALNVMASRNLSFKVQVSAGTPLVEQIGNPTALLSQQISWNGNGQVRWERGPVSLGWVVRYFDEIQVRPQDYIAQGATRAPRAFEHDIYVSHRLGTVNETGHYPEFLSGTSFNFGIKNVMNRKPRFWAAATGGSDGGGNIGYDSVIGRSFWLRIKKEFN